MAGLHKRSVVGGVEQRIRCDRIHLVRVRAFKCCVEMHAIVDDGTTDVRAELIPVELWVHRLVELRNVEGLVTPQLKRFPMKAVGTALGNDRYEPAHGQSVLRRELRNVDLEFLHAPLQEVLARFTHLSKDVRYAVDYKSVGVIARSRADLHVV